MKILKDLTFMAKKIHNFFFYLSILIHLQSLGWMAEWLCSGLQSRLRRFDSGFSLDFMKIGIIGYGFVGGISFLLKKNAQVFKVDPKLNTNIDDLKKFDPDAVFVCVPTPMNEDGSVDSKILLSVLKEIKIKNLNCLIVLKSTIHPGIIKRIDNLIGEFVYNPEFLREKHAKSDFINSEFIVFGGKKEPSSLLAKIYSENTKCKNKNYIYTDAISASLLKYTVNSFLATKVIFFNQFKELFDNSGAQEDWKKFIEYLKNDKRIGDSIWMFQS